MNKLMNAVQDVGGHESHVSDEHYPHPTRRAYPRMNVSIYFELRLEVGRLGVKPTRGVTVDLSSGGVLARVGRTWPVGTRCLVRFLDQTEERIKPSVLLGTVRRDTRSRDGYCVALEFETPLEVFEFDDAEKSSEGHNRPA